MQHLLTPDITDMNLSPADPQSNSVDTVIISQTTVKPTPVHRTQLLTMTMTKEMLTASIY